jgi:acyl-CoA synthetase (AMP-forming)/AMP-acid ligase II
MTVQPITPCSTPGAALADSCLGRIAPFNVLVKFFGVDEYPQRASGKFRKSELRELAAAGKQRLLE